MNSPTGTNEPIEYPKGLNGTTGTSAYWSCCANVPAIEPNRPPTPPRSTPSTLTLTINGEVIVVDRNKIKHIK
jgi:hypothetical protein